MNTFVRCEHRLVVGSSMTMDGFVVMWLDYTVDLYTLPVCGKLGNGTRTTIIHKLYKSKGSQRKFVTTYFSSFTIFEIILPFYKLICPLWKSSLNNKLTEISCSWSQEHGIYSFIRWTISNSILYPCTHLFAWQSYRSLNLHLRMINTRSTHCGCRGCSTLFPVEHDWKPLEHKGLKQKASLRREAPKGGGWGRGSPPPAWPPPAGGVRVVSPGNFWKITSKWCILVYFRAVIAKFKTENLYEKICVSLRKDFILDKINY